MAAVDITISGMLYDKLNRTTQNVVLIGEATLTGLGVGGGPIVPPPLDPNAPHPAHPIVLPGDPGWEPPVPPTGTPDDNGFIKPPPPGGGWAYHEDYGWMYAPGPGQAGPKTTAAPPPKK